MEIIKKDTKTGEIIERICFISGKKVKFELADENTNSPLLSYLHNKKKEIENKLLHDPKGDTLHDRLETLNDFICELLNKFDKSNS